MLISGLVPWFSPGFESLVVRAQYVYVWSPAYIWVVYVARVHVHAAYTRLRLFSRLRGIRDWGHGFWVHRVDKFGRVRAVYIM